MTLNERILIPFFFSQLLSCAISQAPEPFPYLHGDDPTGGPRVSDSPDPLIRYRWMNGINRTALQVYDVNNITNFHTDEPSSFKDLTSLMSKDTNVTVVGPGSILLDFGVEHAAWFEFESPDLGTQVSFVKTSISEFNTPWPGKSRTPIKYGTTYRLETNTELYEGVRFAWITFQPQSSTKPIRPWHITAVRLVAQVKAENYTGSFHSTDKKLNQIWYTGAYGVRLNMNDHYFGSILMDRGDRVSLQGDSHPTMASSLVALADYPLVSEMLDQLNSVQHSVIDSGIMAYPIYWTMSVNDYFWASGDKEGFLRLAPDLAVVLDNVISKFGTNPNIVWMGWDDRIGNGWCGTCNQEAQLAFATLVIRACRDYAHSLDHAGQSSLAIKYNTTANKLTSKLRAIPGPGGGPWYTAYGLHASANAINAGIPTHDEMDIIFSKHFNDSVTICSWSPFNQYWIVQALGNMGKMDYALASVRLCWGTMLELGKGCFWELYSPEWSTFLQDGDKAPTRPSYCHPWSSGVTAWMTHTIAGITPLLPGYEKYLAIPYLSNDLPNVSSTLSISSGKIKLSAVKNYRYVNITVDSPSIGIVGIPLQNEFGCSLDSLSVDGISIEINLYENNLGNIHTGIGKLNGFTSELTAGCHIVIGLYCACQENTTDKLIPDQIVSITTAAGKAIPTFPPFPKPQYPGSGILDLKTRGTWLEKYGKLGYVLFGFNDGEDLVKLPSFVNDVSVFRLPGNKSRIFVGNSTTNSAYLQNPIIPSGSRSLGMVGKSDEGYQGTVIDINVTGIVNYRIAMYMVGKNADSKQVIRVMDLKTKSVIAPSPIIRNFNGGVYWILKYTRSVRLRVMGIYDGAWVSAVMFDTD